MIIDCSVTSIIEKLNLKHWICWWLIVPDEYEMKWSDIDEIFCLPSKCRGDESTNPKRNDKVRRCCKGDLWCQFQIRQQRLWGIWTFFVWIRNRNCDLISIELGVVNDGCECRCGCWWLRWDLILRIREEEEGFDYSSRHHSGEPGNS